MYMIRYSSKGLGEKIKEVHIQVTLLKLLGKQTHTYYTGIKTHYKGFIVPLAPF